MMVVLKGLSDNYFQHCFQAWQRCWNVCIKIGILWKWTAPLMVSDKIKYFAEPIWLLYCQTFYVHFHVKCSYTELCPVTVLYLNKIGMIIRVRSEDNKKLNNILGNFVGCKWLY
jgi:hypothetical protein